MLLPITLTFAAACALLNLWLAIRCARFRIRDKILHGDAGHGLLARRMRAHANFIEYTPIILILFALIELAAGASLWLWIGALAYVLARVAHAFGMDADRPTAWRAGGRRARHRLWPDARNAGAAGAGGASIASRMARRQRASTESATNGLVRRSCAKLLIGPWPGTKAVSPPKGQSFPVIASINC